MPPDDDVILIAPDAVIAALVPKFLETRRLDVVLIVDLLARDAFAELQALGHRLKGQGHSYGCDGISEIGEALEDAAARQDRADIRGQAAALDSYLRRVSIAS